MLFVLIYVVRVKNRDSFLEALKEQEVFCGIHYPVPLHLQDAYGSLGHNRGDFPVAEKCAEEFLSLPMFTELKEVQIEWVREKLNNSIVKFL